MYVCFSQNLSLFISLLRGKCSHGGFFDRTSRQDPVGGINKDDLSSDHASLHLKATDVALEASMELLEDIRVAVGENNFLQYGPNFTYWQWDSG